MSAAFVRMNGLAKATTGKLLRPSLNKPKHAFLCREFGSLQRSQKKAANPVGSGFFGKIGVARCRSDFSSDDVHAAGNAVEHDLAVDEGKEGMVTATTDAYTWMHFRAALADNDVTGDDRLAAVFFHAEAFAA